MEKRTRDYTIAGGDNIEFQQQAIHELINKSDITMYRGKSEKLTDKDKRLLLYAPVGSGKTVIASAYMEYLQEKVKEKFAYVWLSPGEGGLHKQSEDSAKFFSDKLNVVGTQKIITQKRFKENDVLFLNWEIIRQDGNILRRKGEDTYLEECANNSEDLKIIVLVDEAHRARNKEVIDIFKPSLVVDITATPNIGEYKEDNIVEVDMQDVIDAGIIKKQVNINVGIKRNDRITLVNESIKLRKKIEERFREKTETSHVPLVLIQISNKSKNDTKKEVQLVESVKEQLILGGVNPDKIGVWLSERRENIEKDIRHSDIEFLIFKQAIATGWDCPRSHILLRLRDIKTETFDLQTIGRILRTVERKHYGDELIDVAYILTQYDTLSYTPTPEFKNKILTEENKAELKQAFKDEFKGFRLPMEKVNRNSNYIVDTVEIKRYIRDALDNDQVKGMRIKEGKLQREFESAISKTKDMLDGKIDKNSKRYDLGDIEIRGQYKRSIQDLYGKMNIERIIRSILGGNINKVSKLYMSNKDILEGYINKGLDNYKKYEIGKIKNTEDISFEISKEVYYPNITESNTNLYTYNKRPDLDKEYTKSSSEEYFAEWLDSNKKVKYWLKNGTSASDFSIPYIDTDGMYRNYFPDFIIFVGEKENIKLYIVDVKGTFEKGDVDNDNVVQKYKYGKKYEESVDLGESLRVDDIEVSMVKFRDNNMSKPYICKHKEFSNDITQGWEEFVI